MASQSIASSRPSPVGIAGDFVMVLATIGVAGQVLAPVLDPAQRTFECIASQARQTSSGSRIPL